MTNTVIPANAGIQVVHLIDFQEISPTHWIPAFAGMTGYPCNRGAKEPTP